MVLEVFFLGGGEGGNVYGEDTFWNTRLTLSTKYQFQTYQLCIFKNNYFTVTGLQMCHNNKVESDNKQMCHVDKFERKIEKMFEKD